MTSRKEEGDYVDMSGLVFIDYFNILNLNKNILWLLDDSFICIWHVWISLNTHILMAEKIFSLWYFRMTGHKEEDPQPSTSGTGKKK